MVATLNRSIITDYVPAARPPWVLLAVLVGLVAFVLPRDLLPTAVGVSVGVIVAAGLVNWVWVRFAASKDDSGDGHAGVIPTDDPSRLAA